MAGNRLLLMMVSWRKKRHQSSGSSGSMRLQYRILTKANRPAPVVANIASEMLGEQAMLTEESYSSDGGCGDYSRCCRRLGSIAAIIAIIAIVTSSSGGSIGLVIDLVGIVVHCAQVQLRARRTIAVLCEQ